MDTQPSQLPAKVEVLDTTLRDGAQAEGIAFSLEDKMAVVRALDALGVSYIESGNPASNPKDLAFFARMKESLPSRAKLVAFGATCRRDAEVEDDPGCRALLAADTPCVAIFGKAWDLHVREVLRTTPEENLRMVAETVAFFKRAGREVLFDAEHFFDGYKESPGYAMEVLSAAAGAGADCLVLCDTNGGCFPDEVFRMTRTVCERFDLKIGIHCHNDSGCAVANTIEAVRAGAVHVQGTFTGLGERCGNAALSSVIPGLQLRRGVGCIPPQSVPRLTETARAIAEIANFTLDRSAPYVGLSAFAHKGGMHIDGVGKNPRTFEHIEPQSVGNERRFLMSEVAGRRAVMQMVGRITPPIPVDEEQAAALANELKRLEYEGFQYEAAEASFELMVRRVLGLGHDFYTLMGYRVLNESTEAGESSAMVKVSVGGVEEITAAEGDGPVHAIDRALRKALEGFYPSLKAMRLTDYKVRVLESRDATAAKVRVLIQSANAEDVWTTVGVSTNIIEASWHALNDSIVYRLTKDAQKEKGESIV